MALIKHIDSIPKQYLPYVTYQLYWNVLVFVTQAG